MKYPSNTKHMSFTITQAVNGKQEAELEGGLIGGHAYSVTNVASVIILHNITYISWF